MRRRATAALQAGLQPAEQLLQEGQAPTTIAPRLERGRVAAKVGAMAGELMAWTDQQDAVLDQNRADWNRDTLFRNGVNL